jgi:hypothetical protein
MQREQRRDPRHLPNPAERKRTTEPLKTRSDKATADADQIKRPGSSDIDRPNNQA